ncbi:MAG TPA: hypothetical protein VG986_04800 [Pseudolabrys sp.]|nr:hypothetical protein [Pseudolabrys sp.]
MDSLQSKLASAGKITPGGRPDQEGKWYALLVTEPSQSAPTDSSARDIALTISFGVRHGLRSINSWLSDWFLPSLRMLGNIHGPFRFQ